MRKLRLIFLFMALGACAAYPAFGQSLETPSASGQDIIKAVSEARGKVVVLNFWASWCPPCREEIPDLIELRKHLPEGKVFMIGVSLDQDPSQFAMFKSKAGFNYPVYLAKPDVAQAFTIRAIPRTVVYSPKGEMVHSQEGYISGEDLEQLIKKFSGS
jgi:thiol-disulfide isomerase/thioredoxin